MKSRLALLVFAASLLLAQPRNVRLTDENAGFDTIIQTLVSAFDHADILALGEDHGREFDSDLRIGIVRHPDFAKKVRFIVVEFARTAQQPILDRYIRGEDVPISETGVWDSPVYANFLTAVREVNSGLPDESRLRVLAGGADPLAVSMLKEQVLEKHSKTLVVYGAGHLFKTDGRTNLFSSTGGGITKTLETDYPGRTFVVITLGGPGREYEKFESVLKTPVRPVLIPLQERPFRDFTAKEFVGSKLLKRLPNGRTISLFQDSGLTLGDLADACVYTGNAADVTPR